MSVRVETNIGDFVLQVHCDQVPKTSYNFLKLCKIGYYNWSIFLRVEPNFIAQTGDPTNTGNGGESIWSQIGSVDKRTRFFPDEFRKSLKHSIKGTVSMASAGSDRNASQFFITLADDLDFLDNQSTVFAHVIEGLELLDIFNNDVFCDTQHRPLQDIFIKRTVILEDPFEDPKDLPEIKKNDSPSESFLKYKRIAFDDESLRGEVSEKSEEQIESERRETEAASHALVLEIIGDLPTADIKPPENILFVCRLNPLTTSEDLKMIFSRFGPISSLEIIKDRGTGDSLGYAFIEYEGREACEEAYLKMDNVLIDDRRIHVDFSQSVSKLHGKWIAERKRKSSEGKGSWIEKDKSGNRDVNRTVRNDDKRDHRHNYDRRDHHRDYDRRDHRSGRDRSRSRSRHRDRSQSRHRHRTTYRSRSPHRK